MNSVDGEGILLHYGDIRLLQKFNLKVVFKQIPLK